MATKVSRIKGLDEIHAQIDAHPGKIARDEWENLKRTFVYIYKQNRDQLIKFLKEPSQNDKLSIELIQNVRPSNVSEIYTGEVLRHLYNYLASLSALVDQGMRLEKRYEEEVGFKEFLEKRSNLINSDINSFFGNLRNYILHYGTPPIGWQVTLCRDTNNKCVYYLSKEQLLKWDRWSGGSKRYINSQERVDLLESINVHGKMIDEVYKTFLNLFADFHGKDIDAVNKLIRRRNMILSGKIKL